MNTIMLPLLFKKFSRTRISNAFSNFVKASKNYCTNPSKSLYAVLGLKPDASDEDIKQAYYSLSKKYHPDRNIGNKTAEEKILEVNAAFEILGNKAEKEKYDDKTFPKVWERNSFIYDHDSRPEKDSVTYRRVFKNMAYGPDRYYKHLRGAIKRKHRHNIQKLVFHRGQSSSKLSKTFFK